MDELSVRIGRLEERMSAIGERLATMEQVSRNNQQQHQENLRLMGWTLRVSLASLLSLVSVLAWIVTHR